MSRLPWLKFYPADWLSDAVAGCSLAARGLWIDLLCIMHKSSHYGYLESDGKPIPDELLARQCGCDNTDEYRALLEELFAAGVPSRTPQGIIYNRRMVRDQEQRQGAAERQRKHRSHASVTRMSQEEVRSQKLEARSQKKSTDTAPSPSAPDVCEQAVVLWNAERGPLPEVQKLTEGRRRKIQARVHSDGQFLEKFTAAVRKARQTPFLCGAGERGWKADFDSFLTTQTTSPFWKESTTAGKGESTVPTKELAIISARPGNSPIKELVGQHLVRLAELIRKDGAPYPLTPQLVNLWVNVFERPNLKPEQVEAAFHKAERACKFWPSPADVLGFITTAKSNATVEAAEQAWKHVLEIRRTRWSPDAPGGFYGGKPRLSPCVEQACRASGVFRDHNSLEALHVWAKKNFIESFTRWDETGELQNLLPDGEIKRLLTDAAQAKALPAPAVDFHALHERGLRYVGRNKLLDTYGRASRDLPAWEPEKRAEIEAELRNYGERFKAAMEKKQVAGSFGAV